MFNFWYDIMARTKRKKEKGQEKLNKTEGCLI